MSSPKPPLQSPNQQRVLQALKVANARLAQVIPAIRQLPAQELQRSLRHELDQLETALQLPKH